MGKLARSLALASALLAGVAVTSCAATVSGSSVGRQAVSVSSGAAEADPVSPIVLSRLSIFGAPTTRRLPLRMADELNGLANDRSSDAQIALHPDARFAGEVHGVEFFVSVGGEIVCVQYEVEQSEKAESGGAVCGHVADLEALNKFNVMLIDPTLDLGVILLPDQCVFVGDKSSAHTLKNLIVLPEAAIHGSYRCNGADPQRIDFTPDDR